MELTSEIKENHRRLSGANVEFLDYVRQNPACLKRANFDELKWDQLFQFQSWPTFLSPSARRTFADASVRVFKLIKSALPRFFDLDVRKIARYLELPVYTVEYALSCATESNLDNFWGRGDFVYTDAGDAKCIEFNVGAGLGGWQLPIWENMVQKNPYIAAFIAKQGIRVTNKNLLVSMLEHVVGATLARLRSHGGAPPCLNTAVLILDSRDIDLSIPPENLALVKQMYRQLIRFNFSVPEGELYICRGADLRERDGGLYYHGHKVDAALEFTMGALTPVVIAAAKREKVVVFNGPAKPLLSNKLLPALLSQNEDSPRLTAEEQRTVKTYIPWTRKTVEGENTYNGEKISLMDFVLENREKMVLKPARGLGGKDIVIGKNCSESPWREAVQRAFRERAWAVQEFVPSATYIYQSGEDGAERHHATWGFFVFGDTFAGSWLRVLPTADTQGVINAHQGARTSVILEVGA